MPVKRIVTVYPENSSLGLALAEHLHAAAARAKSDGRNFTVAVSGGSVPQILVAGLSRLSQPANHGPDYSHWRIFLADERCVAQEHADSNGGALASSGLLAKLPGAQTVFPNYKLMTGSRAADIDAAAQDYEAQIAKHCGGGSSSPKDAPKFDAVVLGMGPDGHTCSLFPDHRVAKLETCFVASVSDSPKPPPLRITLTTPAVVDAASILFVVTGSGKADTVRDVLCDTECSLPASVITRRAEGAPDDGRHRQLHWLLDQGAAAKLPPQ